MWVHWAQMIKFLSLYLGTGTNFSTSWGRHQCLRTAGSAHIFGVLLLIASGPLPLCGFITSKEWFFLIKRTHHASHFRANQTLFCYKITCQKLFNSIGTSSSLSADMRWFLGLYPVVACTPYHDILAWFKRKTNLQVYIHMLLYCP